MAHGYKPNSVSAQAQMIAIYLGPLLLLDSSDSPHLAMGTVLHSGKDFAVSPFYSHRKLHHEGVMYRFQHIRLCSHLEDHSRRVLPATLLPLQSSGNPKLQIPSYKQIPMFQIPNTFVSWCLLFVCFLFLDAWCFHCPATVNVRTFLTLP